MVNLSLLENPTRTASIRGAYTIEYKGKELDIETQRLISKRARALDDHRIRFVYALSDQFIHDKSCTLVDKIKYWDFGSSEELLADRQLCPQCKKRIYIKKAIQSDTKRFGLYLHFFDQGRVGIKILEQFLYNEGMKLHMESPDELIVKYQEDTWRIKMNAQGCCSLYHNNYVMVSETERYITSGFHQQKYHPPYLTGVLAYIAGYNWQKHLEPKQDVIEAVPVQEITIESKQKGFVGRLKQWFLQILKQRK